MSHVCGNQSEQHNTHFAEQLAAPVDLPSLRPTGTLSRDVAHVPAYLLVVVARQRGIRQVVAQLMGHANVDTTLNVYTQVLDGSVRDAVEKVSGELFTIVHKPGRVGAVTD
jgi:integrase